MALNKAKVLTVTSVKGGSGTSTTVLNLAGIISKFDKKVLIIDLNFYNSSIAPLLNIDNLKDIYNLFEDINNNTFESLSDYVEKYNESISVLASPKDPRNAKKINSSVLNTILYKAIMKYDVVIIDTNYMFNDINLVAYDASDLILYVINNDFISLKNMKSVINILNDMDNESYKILLNNSVCRDRDNYTKYEIETILDHDLDYSISSNLFIKDINKYILEGKILTLEKEILKNKNDIKEYEKIISDFLDESKVI